MSDKNPKVLYVEDEPDIRAVALLALEDVGGFEVCPCSSGSEAVARADAFAPDVILLDVMMPGMDGPTTMSKLRALAVTKSTPVVFMTAKVQPHEAAQYRALGAVGVIAKPFDPMTLAEQVRALWCAS